MTSKGAKALIIIVAILLLGGVLFLINYKWISNTYQKITTGFSKFGALLTEEYDDAAVLLEKLDKVEGVKEIDITDESEDDSDAEISYLKINIGLEKGYNFNKVANEIVKILFEYYPESKSKDKISVIEMNQLDLGFVYYHMSKNGISRSPAEWEKVISK